MQYSPEQVVIDPFDASEDSDEEVYTHEQPEDETDDGERLPRFTARIHPLEMTQKALSILNKITYSTYDTLSQQLLLVVDAPLITEDITPATSRRAFVARLVELAVQGGDRFQELYIKLAALLARDLSPDTWWDASHPHLRGGPLFAHYTVSVCREYLDNILNITGPTSNTRQTRFRGVSPISLKWTTTIEDIVPFIKFCASIYLEDVLPDRIMQTFIRKLLFDGAAAEDENTPPRVEYIHAFCKAFERIGLVMDADEKRRTVVDYYFGHIQTLLDCLDPFVTGRSRYLLLNIIHLRERNWVPNMTVISDKETSSSDSQQSSPTRSTLSSRAPSRSHTSAKQSVRAAAGHQRSPSPVEEHHDGAHFELLRHNSVHTHRSIMAEILPPVRSRSPSPESQRLPVLVRGASFEMFGSGNAREEFRAAVYAMSPITSAGGLEGELEPAHIRKPARERVLEEFDDLDEDVIVDSPSEDELTDPNSEVSEHQIFDGETVASLSPGPVPSLDSGDEDDEPYSPVHSGSTDLDSIIDGCIYSRDFRVLERTYATSPRNASRRIEIIKRLVQEGILAGANGAKGTGIMSRFISESLSRIVGDELDPATQQIVFLGFVDALSSAPLLASPVDEPIPLFRLLTEQNDRSDPFTNSPRACLALLLFGARFSEDEVVSLCGCLGPDDEDAPPAMDVEGLIRDFRIVQIQDQLFDLWRSGIQRRISDEVVDIKPKVARKPVPKLHPAM